MAGSSSSLSEARRGSSVSTTCPMGIATGVEDGSGRSRPSPASYGRIGSWLGVRWTCGSSEGLPSAAAVALRRARKRHRG